MNNQEIIEMIQKTESATFRIDGLGETTIPTKKLEFLVDAHEKQIPKKPICIEDKMWTCPSCDNNLMWKWEEYPNELTPRGYGNKLCLCCGQAIDWGNKDD